MKLADWWSMTGRWKISYLVYRVRLMVERCVVEPLNRLERRIAK